MILRVKSFDEKLEFLLKEQTKVISQLYELKLDYKAVMSYWEGMKELGIEDILEEITKDIWDNFVRLKKVKNELCDKIIEMSEKEIERLKNDNNN